MLFFRIFRHSRMSHECNSLVIAPMRLLILSEAIEKLANLVALLTNIFSGMSQEQSGFLS
jgi:hypothetical protein